MIRTRDAIRAGAGGITKCNTWTKITCNGRAVSVGRVPGNPPELMFLPKWFSVRHLQYVGLVGAMFVPLSIIRRKSRVKRSPGLPPRRALARPARRRPTVHLPWDPHLLTWRNLFLRIDSLLKFITGTTRAFFAPVRQCCGRNGGRSSNGRTGGGLGAIFPAMANYVMCLRRAATPTDSYLVSHGSRNGEAADQRRRTLSGCSPVFRRSGTRPSASTRSTNRDAPRPSGRWSPPRAGCSTKEVRRPGDWRSNTSECHRYTEPNKPIGGWFFEIRQ